MSSSNSVRVAFIEETTYGVTPGTGNFSTARFTSESLSATPDTAESKQIRIDRMSSGQVVVGLSVTGDLKIELAKEAALDLLISSAMYSSWSPSATVTVALTIATAGPTITRATGSFNSPQLKVGDFLTLAGFSNAANNVVVMVTQIVSATVIKYVGPSGIVDEVGVGTSYDCADNIGIGTTKKSFSVEKKFTDLTDKGINYRGMIASGLELKFAYGELATGAINLEGNDYETVDVAADLITDSRTLDPAATSQTLNGSVDMPFLASDVFGSWSTTGLDLQSVSMKLNNNLLAQKIIGEIAPINYSAGTAHIAVDLSAYVSNTLWAILGKKLTQTPFSLAFMVKNADGWYGFYMPQVQVTFQDPASGGQNQDIILTMTGTAKVGALGESALTISRS
jgi:hypothetical protein